MSKSIPILDRCLAAWQFGRGRVKQLAGRTSGNRLLAFEGEQECLRARLEARGLAGRKRPSAALPSVVRETR